MNSKFDRQYIGILIGFFLPILTSFLFYAFLYKGEGSYFNVIRSLNELHLFGTLLATSILPNLLMFFVATKFNYLVAAQGILYSTGFYVIIASLYRFLL